MDWSDKRPSLSGQHIDSAGMFIGIIATARRRLQEKLTDDAAVRHRDLSRRARDETAATLPGLGSGSGSGVLNFFLF